MAKNRDGSYAYLDQLSTEQLMELLRADYESKENGCDDVVFHILEVMEEREKQASSSQLPDQEEAWDEFQQYYNIPEGDGMSLYPSQTECKEQAASPETPAHEPGKAKVHTRRWLKPVLAVAAVVAVLFTGMVAAQAAGFDVFGAIARWTNETFRFVMTSEENSGDSNIIANTDTASEGPYSTLVAAFEENGFPVELVPKWYPAKYKISESSFTSSELCDLINTKFSNKDDQFYSIVITRYHSSEALNFYTFEKDNAGVEAYSNKGYTFYILSNLNSVTATWSDGCLVETISGNLSIDELKLMIDSIGG